VALVRQAVSRDSEEESLTKMLWRQLRQLVVRYDLEVDIRLDPSGPRVVARSRQGSGTRGGNASRKSSPSMLKLGL
jgi:hypothetical protein